MPSGRSSGGARGVHPIFSAALGVIFDLNGVLAIDEPLHERAFAAALAPHGVTLTHDLYQAAILGQTDEAGLLRLAAAVGRDLAQIEVLSAKRRYYWQWLPEEGRQLLAPAAGALVAALTLSGARLALASAASISEGQRVAGDR
ncbi:MAG TPA: hypothetical protein VF808_06900 [Ktedonobacterales bacterium]